MSKQRLVEEVSCPIPGSKAYRFGRYSVIVGVEGGRWHMSISHPSMYPGWDAIRDARYMFMPKDIWVAMMLPPPSSYVNVDQNCFHLWEIKDPVITGVEGGLIVP
jgi:hypothetical protein